jgi:tetratricopeptide (TPR) repeat protein
MHRIAAKLKELAPDSAAADLAESIIHFYDWDFPAAKREAEQAIKTSPGYELGHIWYGYMLMIWRRTSEARTQADISQRLAPSKATSYRLRGHTYYVERNFTDAIHWYRQAIEMDRHELPAHLRMGQAFRAMGDYTNALGHLETAALLRNPGNESETRRSYDKLRQAFKDGGARGYWQEEWKRTETRPDEDFYRKAVVQIHLGDTNAALDWLEKSFVTHERSGFESAMIYLLLDESWDGLHDHPRFKVLLDRIGFTKVMPPKK